MDPEQCDGQCPSIFRSLFRLSKTRIFSRYFDSKSKGLFVVVFFFFIFILSRLFFTVAVSGRPGYMLPLVQLQISDELCAQVCT